VKLTLPIGEDVEGMIVQVQETGQSHLNKLIHRNESEEVIK
jgi:hypothetical protein